MNLANIGHKSELIMKFLFELLFNNKLKAMVFIFTALYPTINHSAQKAKACETSFLNKETLTQQLRQKKEEMIWEMIRLAKEKNQTEDKKQVEVTQEKQETFSSFESQELKLIKAARDGKKETVKKLLKDGENPNQQNKWGETPLFRAAGNGHKDIVEILLKAGADPNIKTTQGGTTALMWTVLKNEAEPSLKATIQGKRRAIIELLMKYGADPSLRDITARSVFAYGAKEMKP